MIMKNTFKKEIEDFLFSKYDAKKSSDIWVNIKCPYCDANSSKRHFYVCMDDNRPMVYRCFRASCGVRGVLNRKIARHLGIVSTHLLEFIDKEYLTNSKFIKDVDYYRMSLEESDDPDYRGLLGDISDDVEEYFYERTGHSAKEYQYIFRICSDIKYFFKYPGKGIDKDIKKKIYALTKNGKFIYLFNDTYTMLYYREIDGDRKGKLSIVTSDYLYKQHKPYTILRGEMDYGKDNKIYIAEGPFDIINTYLHFSNNEEAYYVATTGFTSTKNILKEITKYIFKPDVIIMSDSDVIITTYKNMLTNRKNNNILLNRVNRIYIYYNESGHDVGNINEKITLKKYRIK